MAKIWLQKFSKKSGHCASDVIVKLYSVNHDAVGNRTVEHSSKQLELETISGQ